jgi:murein DD-endopeptidase MepM/ murein hydrolase activator NlpD
MKRLALISLLALIAGCETTGTGSGGPQKGPKAFGEYFPGTYIIHKGLDLTDRYGAPIIASADGVVIRTLDKSINLSPNHPMFTWGKFVEIRHDTPIGFVITRYQHLDSVTVREQQLVKRGEVIGKNGTTGARGPHDTRPPAVPHVHFEMEVQFRHVDPERHLVGCFDASKQYKPDEYTYPVQCKPL